MPHHLEGCPHISNLSGGIRPGYYDIGYMKSCVITLGTTLTADLKRDDAILLDNMIVVFRQGLLRFAENCSKNSKSDWAHGLGHVIIYACAAFQPVSNRGFGLWEREWTISGQIWITAQTNCVEFSFQFLF